MTDHGFNLRGLIANAIEAWHDDPHQHTFGAAADRVLEVLAATAFAGAVPESEHPCWGHYRQPDGSVGHCEGPAGHWGTCAQHMIVSTFPNARYWPTKAAR